MSNMPQGISVFDEHLRLRVWNAGFLEVLNLPASAVYDGVHFSDLIRIPATRGEYGPGEIEDHVSRITSMASSIQPRPPASRDRFSATVTSVGHSRPKTRFVAAACAMVRGLYRRLLRSGAGGPRSVV